MMAMQLAALTQAQWVSALLVTLVTVISAVLYLRVHRRRDASFVLAAGLFLVATVLPLELRTSPNEIFVIDSRVENVSSHSVDVNDLIAQAKAASKVQVLGHGLRANQWHDLPSRPLLWDQKGLNKDSLWLEFPRRLQQGRIFTLRVKRGQAGAAWRLKLFAENDQLLAQGEGVGDSLSVDWLPPLAERLVLKARVENTDGRLIDQGAIPLDVVDSEPLKVMARFASPSFDAQSLLAMLKDSRAVIDSQITIGKNLARIEQALDSDSGKKLGTNLILIDAAYLEQVDSHTRQLILQQVTDGKSFLVLAGNASQTTFWQRELGLHLTATSANSASMKTPQDDSAEADKWQVGAGMQLSRTTLGVRKTEGQVWRTDDAQAWLMQRNWGKGKITWLAAADWHRYRISAPQALAAWWQQTLDFAGVETVQTLRVDSDEFMPLPGQRLRVCAQGLEQDQIRFAQTKEHAHVRATEDQLEQACAAVVPQTEGWLTWAAKAVSTQENVVGAFYVYAEKDWKQWQNGLKQKATEAYSLRIPAKAEANTQRLPKWPLVLLFMASLLALWYREKN